MWIILTIILFFAKYLCIAAIGLLMYADLEMTKDVSAGIYSIYLTFACITFFALLFFLLGKKTLWLIVFLVCGSVYISMYKKAPEISEIHEKSIFNEQNLKESAGTAQQLYKIWKFFH